MSMATLTAFVLAAFVGYAASWYVGAIEGNFPLLLLIATGVTGIYWLAERFYFLPQRQAAARVLDDRADIDVREAKERLLMQPWWLDWTAGLFPVLLVVFVLRSFLFEPFKIPSGSMIPTLLIGDLILVNKYHYGLRLPVSNTKITQGHAVQRGDVVVFHYPPNPNLDYIKRVVGVPGDEVAYLNKTLTINGQSISKEGLPDFFEQETLHYYPQFVEELPINHTGNAADKLTHHILNDPARPAFVPGASDFAYKDQCHYTPEGVTCKVPQGHYFMMGDNRDNSLDSRYWGFVPDANIVGKAFYVWMNFGDIKRIGAFQ